MPTVPGNRAAIAQSLDQTPTPEQVLMTAADMNNRGQLTTDPTQYSDPKSQLTLPGHGRSSDKAGKRRGSRVSSSR